MDVPRGLSVLAAALILPLALAGCRKEDELNAGHPDLPQVAGQENVPTDSAPVPPGDPAADLPHAGD